MGERTRAERGWRRRWGQRGTAAATIAGRLTYEAVTHAYGDVASVGGVTLDIAPGEIVCLLGRSGCGKTTLLRLAAGVERPSGGRILFDGQEMAGPSVFVPPERRGVGLMFQDFALFPHLTLLDNVMFGLANLPRGEAAAEARQALARVGLADHARDFPHALSGGEQQRVALARAIAPRPKVLLMDEPFSGLDRRLRDDVREETLAVLRETRATAVIVTHDPEEAMRMADRIALMREGRLVQVGPPRQLYAAPADLAAARFFSDVNEVPGVVKSGKVATPVGVFAAPNLPEGAAAVVCIRPQGVKPRAPGFCVPGRLVRRRFLGEVDQFDIAVAGLDVPLRARVPAPPPLAERQDIGVDIDPAEVLVFAAPAT